SGSFCPVRPQLQTACSRGHRGAAWSAGKPAPPHRRLSRIGGGGATPNWGDQGQGARARGPPPQGEPPGRVDRAAGTEGSGRPHRRRHPARHRYPFSDPMLPHLLAKAATMSQPLQRPIRGALWLATFAALAAVSDAVITIIGRRQFVGSVEAFGWAIDEN